MSKDEARLNRQLAAIERTVPVGRHLLRALRKNRYRYLRIPLALLFIIGGFGGFLPVLGFWMLPLGLVLLAVDVPAMQPAVSAALIRTRRRLDLWSRRLRNRWRG